MQTAVSNEKETIALLTCESVDALAQMFFLTDGVRLRKMTCAFFELPSHKAEADECLRHLYECHLLLGYLYAHPHPSGGVFLPFENASLYVFRLGDTPGNPGMVVSSLVHPSPEQDDRLERIGEQERPKEDLIPGYSGTRNGKTPLWVAPGSRVYPELPHLILNYNQELPLNLEMHLSNPYHWALEILYCDAPDFPEDVRSRVFIAIEWYLRSCQDAITEAEAIVHLAVALESLLHIREGEKLTERFKDAILTILGPVPRLELWIEQFYNARSKAVHEGIPSATMFYPFDKDRLKKKKQEKETIHPHRPLLAYGRRIFRLCLANFLAGTIQARMTALDALLIPNQDRIDALCQQLNESKEAEKGLLAAGPAIYELCDQGHDLVDPNRVTLESVIGTVKLALRAFKQAVPTLPKPAGDVIDEILADKGEPSSQLLTKIEECATHLRADWKADDRSPAGQTRGIVIMLLGYASKPEFRLYCYYKDQTKPAHSNA